MVSRLMRPAFDRVDAALLGAYLLVAALGTWTSCLLFHDGVVYLTSAWFGDGWGLFYRQFPTRLVSTLIEFGPVWCLHALFSLPSDLFILFSHILYFAGPLGLWLVLRAVERDRIVSRLYLSIVLAMIYFISELVAGFGLWLIWLVLLAMPERSIVSRIAVSALFAPLLALTHPGVGLLSIVFAALGWLLLLFRRPFPRHLAISATLMGAFLVAFYFITGDAVAPTNPTITPYATAYRYDYVNPLWLLATLALFPATSALWFLLLAPGTRAAAIRWRVAPAAEWIGGAIGLWFAAAGTGLLTYMYARHSAGHVLALALALALVAPAAWLTAARRPLVIYAAIAAVAAVSYNVDLFLFGRFVDRYMAPGVVDVDAARADPWPTPEVQPFGWRIFFKWKADPDYVRNVVVPDYGRYRVALAFYSFFRSDRQSIVFHRLPQGEWIPFECAPVDRALARARDDMDRRFLTFLSGPYCVR
jgi:hypothetical protein